MKELWIPVVGYEGFYEVSNLGNIKSCERVVKHGNHNTMRKLSSRNIKPYENKKNGYLYISLSLDGKIRKVTIHRVVAESFLSLCNGLSVDHIDNNRKNNKVENLRVVSISQNGMNQKLSKANTTGFKGVKLNKDTGRYSAKIKKSGVSIHIGCYSSALEAGKAYDLKALELFGEYSKTNKSLGLY